MKPVMKRSRGSQTDGFNMDKPKKMTVDTSTQISSSTGSYKRNRIINDLDKEGMTIRKLYTEVICNKETAIRWAMDNGLIASSMKCSFCSSDMDLKDAQNYSSDGCRWRCRKKDHSSEASIRKGSWFEKSNLTLEEIIELTYWWSTGCEQTQVCKEMGVSSKTAVDWYSFCREVCEVIIMVHSKPIGGPGTRVQIDESKFGKRKYHRGHKVEGQWVFGGIEEESRQNFMVAVEKRDKKTLIPIIERYILPGTTIISDCWKAYDCLSQKDYEHLKVNHSVEFVNSNGDHTNKIEGHWRQAKKNLPPFGVKKYLFSSHLAEFMWRYTHKESDHFIQFINDVTKVYSPNV
ncbi:uncharacterized protein [Clytia hemisphaerica]|uniref:uncharacterized protein n=1 Tax=Clytia hemisphaerica TaxID=252671 RepID=UPI0034D58447